MNPGQRTRMSVTRGHITDEPQRRAMLNQAIRSFPCDGCGASVQSGDLVVRSGKAAFRGCCCMNFHPSPRSRPPRDAIDESTMVDGCGLCKEDKMYWEMLHADSRVCPTCGSRMG